MVFFKWVFKEKGEKYGGHFRTSFMFSEEQLFVQIVEEY
jgi:hypothetical protein